MNEIIYQTERDGVKVIVRANLTLDTIIACARCAAVLDVAGLTPDEDNLLVTLCPYCGGQL